MLPGRSCPLHYRYAPEVFAGPPALTAETLIVVGGLYGNPEALTAVETLLADEPGDARLVFNGDFHWFDIEREVFADIQRRVLTHTALQGNVEAELGDASGAGCGCGYPDYIGASSVARSNAIMERLQGAITPADREALTALPMTLTAQIGDRRVALLHGDPESLAGWGLAVETMTPADRALRWRLGCADTPLTSTARLADWFRRAGVDCFAATHTCLPFLQDSSVDGRPRAVINNGSAGMSNFRGDSGGLVTRLSLRPSARARYRVALAGLWAEAVPLDFDAARWRRRFSAWWPPGSVAHESYFKRIAEGANFDVESAARGQCELLLSDGYAQRL